MPLIRSPVLLDPRAFVGTDPTDPLSLYRNALADLAAENNWRWGRVFETFISKPKWWKEKYIAHNKRMAEKGVPGAVELLAKVTKLRITG